jgi:hypothetical protein
MKLNRFILRLLFSTVLCLVVIVTFAQPGDPNIDPDVPITGIEILLTIGGILGFRKLITSKKRDS